MAATKTKKSAPVQQRPSSQIRQAADLLKQVSDPTRLQVLMLLTEKEAECLRAARRPGNA